MSDSECDPILEAYAAQHRLSFQAFEALESLSQELQEKVMAMEFEGAADKSAVLLRRVKDAQAGRLKHSPTASVPVKLQATTEAAKEEQRERKPAPVPNQITDATRTNGAPDLETFMAEHEHDLEERVLQAIVALNAEQQANVIGSSLSGVRNKNAVLMSRINKALNGLASSPLREVNTMVELTPEAKAYAAENGLDLQIAQALSSLEPEQLEQVIAQSFEGVRNKAAIVLSRIRDVKRGLAPSPQATISAVDKVSGSVSAELETYAAQYGLNRAVIQAISNLSPELQSFVIAQNFEGVRNIPAVAMSRARNAQRDFDRNGGVVPGNRTAAAVSPTKSGGNAGYPSEVVYQVGPELEAFAAQHCLEPAAVQALSSLSLEMQQEVMAQSFEGVRNKNAVVIGRVRDARQGRSATGEPAEPVHEISAELRAYASELGLTAKAMQELSSIPPDLQEEVMEQSFEGVRNPSAVVMSRIRSARASSAQRSAQTSIGLGGQCSAGVEAYAAENNLEPKVVQALSNLPPDAQEEIMADSLNGVRNINATIMSRINRKKQVLSRMPAAPVSRPARESAPDVDAYVAEHGLNGAAAQALRTLPPDMVERVMADGWTGVRNKSAVVIQRVNKAKSDPQMASSVQAKRNQDLLEKYDALGEDFAADHGAGDDEDGVRWDNLSKQVAGWAGDNDVDEDGLEILSRLKPELQHEVMKWGALNGMNPTAMLIGRIRKIDPTAKVTTANLKAKQAQERAQKMSGTTTGSYAGAVKPQDKKIDASKIEWDDLDAALDPIIKNRLPKKTDEQKQAEAARKQQEAEAKKEAIEKRKQAAAAEEERKRQEAEEKREEAERQRKEQIAREKKEKEDEVAEKLARRKAAAREAEERDARFRASAEQDEEAEEDADEPEEDEQDAAAEAARQEAERKKQAAEEAKRKAQEDAKRQKDEEEAEGQRKKQEAEAEALKKQQQAEAAAEASKVAEPAAAPAPAPQQQVAATRLTEFELFERKKKLKEFEKKFKYHDNGKKVLSPQEYKDAMDRMNNMKEEVKTGFAYGAAPAQPAAPAAAPAPAAPPAPDPAAAALAAAAAAQEAEKKKQEAATEAARKKQEADTEAKRKAEQAKQQAAESAAAPAPQAAAPSPAQEVKATKLPPDVIEDHKRRIKEFDKKFKYHENGKKVLTPNELKAAQDKYDQLKEEVKTGCTYTPAAAGAAPAAEAAKQEAEAKAAEAQRLEKERLLKEAAEEAERKQREAEAEAERQNKAAMEAAASDQQAEAEAEKKKQEQEEAARKKAAEAEAAKKEAAEAEAQAKRKAAEEREAELAMKAAAEEAKAKETEKPQRANRLDPETLADHKRRIKEFDKKFKYHNKGQKVLTDREYKVAMDTYTDLVEQVKAHGPG